MESYGTYTILYILVHTCTYLYKDLCAFAYFSSTTVIVTKLRLGSQSFRPPNFAVSFQSSHVSFHPQSNGWAVHLLHGVFMCFSLRSQPVNIVFGLSHILAGRDNLFVLFLLAS